MNADGYNKRGIAYIRKDRYDQALSYFNKAREKNPRHVGEMTNRGHVYFKTGKYDRAISE